MYILLQWNPATYSRWYLNGNKQVGTLSFSLNYLSLSIDFVIEVNKKGLCPFPKPEFFSPHQFQKSSSDHRNFRSRRGKNVHLNLILFCKTRNSGKIRASRNRIVTHSAERLYSFMLCILLVRNKCF